jgi:hypothetical protein
MENLSKIKPGNEKLKGLISELEKIPYNEEYPVKMNLYRKEDTSE